MNNQFSKFDSGFATPKKRAVPMHQHNFIPLVSLARPRKKFALQLFAFALTSIAIVLVLKGGLYLSSAKQASGEILGAATNAYSDINNASSNLKGQNLASAALLFESASNNIRLAQTKLDDYKALTWIAPQANSADHILAGAGLLAAAGEKLTLALDLFGEFKVSSRGVETVDFNQKLVVNMNLLSQTRDLVYKSSEEFNQVNNIPLDYGGTLQQAKQQVSELGAVLDKLIGLESLYINIFGERKTYFLVFQNYDEQRATGGFIGTYGVVKTDKGAITKLAIDSIYDLDGRIYEQIAAPGPFQPEIPRWGIRDANWFADFPTSAKKLLYFYEKGDETADGVISTTPKLFEDLLQLVGPIEMKEYKVTLTAENFQDVVQYKTSVDYNRKENEPKKMLADFAPVLLDRLTNLPKDKWFSFFQIMQDNLNQRHVLIYSKDEKAQKIIEDLGFSGKVLPAEYDYLSIINSNLGGTKTDLEVEQNVSLSSKILSDDSIINTLTITRKNPNIQNNRDYLRVMVPLGSEFISAVGFDDYPMYKSESEGMRTDPDLAKWDIGSVHSNIFVRTETGKTEFAGWLNVSGNNEKTVTLTYILPFKISQAHSLLVQKQAGSRPHDFEARVTLGGHNVQWVSASVATSLNSVNYKSNSNIDDFWGFVLTK